MECSVYLAFITVYLYSIMALYMLSRDSKERYHS